jgi:hypothetical protein
MAVEKLGFFISMLVTGFLLGALIAMPLDKAYSFTFLICGIISFAVALKMFGDIRE